MDRETFGISLDTMRRCVDERLFANEDRVEAEDAVPDEIIADMRDLGLFDLSVPVERQIAVALGRPANVAAKEEIDV